MKPSWQKFIAYIPVLIGFVLIYVSLDINGTWLWRIAGAWQGHLYVAFLLSWYLVSWGLAGIRLIKEESATLFNRRMLLVQLGYMPAFVGMYTGHWIFRTFVYPSFGIRTINRAWIDDPLFASAVDRTYTIIALVLIALWFICSMRSVKKGLSRLETIIILNAAAVLGLFHFLHRYLFIHWDRYAGAEWVITRWYDVGAYVGNYLGTMPAADSWSSIDPMIFYEYIIRLFIRFMPWIPSNNPLLLVFLGLGLLIVISVIGTKFGKIRIEN